MPPLARIAGEAILAQVDVLHGRIAAADARLEQMFRTEPRAFGGAGRLGVEIGSAFIDLLLLLQPDAARRRVDDALARYPLDELPPRDRPYSNLVRFYAYVGDADRAAAFHEQHLAALSSDERERTDIRFQLDAERAAVAYARGGFDEALPELRRLADTSPCAICLLPDVGIVYRTAGQPDSAIAAFERYIETPMLFRIGNDALMMPIAHRTLAELYEERGDAERAIHHYNRLAELWAGGDPEVQPFVDAARRAVEGKAKDAGHAVSGAASKAKVPLVAGGAALAGAAGGLMVGAQARRHGGLRPSRRRPLVKMRSRDLAKAAREVGSFGAQVGHLASELQHVREEANGAKRRSPVEVVLEGLTARRSRA